MLDDLLNTLQIFFQEFHYYFHYFQQDFPQTFQSNLVNFRFLLNLRQRRQPKVKWTLLTWCPKFLRIDQKFLHTFCFAILIGTKYTDEWRKNCAPFVQSYFTSLFAPCIVMSPESKLLLFSNLLSTIPHVVVTAVMVAISSDENLISSLLVKLIPWLLISPMFAWLLQAYSQEKTQEILVNGINFKLVKFFSTMFVLRALDEVSDILTAMEYFFK